MAQALPLPGSVPSAVSLRDRQCALVRQHYTFVWRLLRRLGVPDADAEDAAQQVFIVATRRLDDIVPGSERSFLFGTATRVASTVRRSRGRRPTFERNLDAIVDVRPLPDEATVERQRLLLLDQLLDELPDALRTVFVLSELEELSNPEISDLLSAPLGTVASRLRRARELFRDASRRVLAKQGEGR